MCENHWQTKKIDEWQLIRFLVALMQNLTCFMIQILALDQLKLLVLGNHQQIVVKS